MAGESYPDTGECARDEDIREVAEVIADIAVRAMMETSNLDRETALRFIRIALAECPD